MTSKPSYANTRADLERVAEVRATLRELRSRLFRLVPSEYSRVDEDYKIAEFHSFELEEIDLLEALTERLEACIERLLAGEGKARGGSVSGLVEETFADVVSNVIQGLDVRLCVSCGGLASRYVWAARVTEKGRVPLCNLPACVEVARAKGFELPADSPPRPRL